jgi:uncharacterized protein
MTSIGAPRSVTISETAARSRVDVLDILRGIALLGMFMVHFNYYEATPRGVEPGAAAAFVEQFLNLFVSERFYAIFGMLFGVGFALQLERSDARGDRFIARYLRRLLALAAFGFIAEGVFGYNVLFGYAMWGVPLILVRRWHTTALIVLLVACAASRPIFNLTRIAVVARQPGGIEQLRAATQSRAAAFAEARRVREAANDAPDWRTVIGARIAFMPKFHRQFSVFPSGSFTLFLLGMIAWRLGLFTRPESRRGLIVALMVGGAASWAFATWVLPIGGPAPVLTTVASPVATAATTMARFSAFGLIREQWLAFTYIGAVLLLVARGPQWVRRFSPFAWAGRMALTNYMAQVMLLDILFSPHGFGLKIPAVLVFPVAIVLFLLQFLASRWWLERYRLGPLEWIWRSFTYWRRQPLLLPANPADVVVAAA